VTLYLDMDGVLMDFESHIAKWGCRWHGDPYIHKPFEQWTPEQRSNDILYKHVMAKQDFWRTMQPMTDAYILWNYCRLHNPHVLTATPHSATYRDRCAADKARSIREFFDPVFPQEQFHAVLRKEKRNFAKPGAVLVDDLPHNCHEWTKAGGTAILHKDALTTIRILQEIYHG
jgi:hypothetical protein